MVSPIEHSDLAPAAGEVVEHVEAASGIMAALSHDTGLWVLISFVLFAALAFKLGRKSVTGKLDGKIQEIKDEIENAERLRVEAQELLAQYQRKQRDAEKEADSIVKNAKTQAKSIKKAMKADLDDLMERREAQLSDRMKRLEENAIAKIKDEAADVAMAATTEMIMQALDDKTQKALADQSIQTISKQLN